MSREKTSQPRMNLIARQALLVRYRSVDDIMRNHTAQCSECRVNEKHLDLCQQIGVEIMTELYTIDTTVMDALLMGAPMDGTVLECISHRLQWDDNTNELDDEHRG